MATGPSWDDTQQKTFTNWFNNTLRGNLKVSKDKVENLANDLSDGLLLITLLENLAKPRKVPRYNKKPLNKIMAIENLGQALKFIKSENIKLVNIGPEDIYNRNPKLTMGLIWTLIGHFQIRSSGKGLTTKQAMKEWLHTLIPDYQIQNFTTDWNDGRAVCALVDRLKPGSCPNHISLNPSNGLENCRRGMGLAEEKLDIPKVLDPEDLNNPDVDDLSVMTYISYFFEPARISLLEWIKAKIPHCNITNLSTDWNTGVNLGALMEACHKGLMPDWNDMDPHKAHDNLSTCLKLAKDRLDIACPVGPKELSDPAVDEIIVATYLSRFKYSQLSANPDEVSFEAPDFSDNGVGIIKVPIIIPVDLGPSPDLVLDHLALTAVGPSAEAVVTLEGEDSNMVAKFIPLEPGLYEFNCKMSGEDLDGSPIQIPVIDPSTWAITDEIPQFILINDQVELYVKGDSYGSSPLVEVDVKNDQDLPATFLEASLWEMEPGTFQLTLTPTDVGRAKVGVSVTKTNIRKSPFEVSIWNPNNCKVTGFDEDNKIVSQDEGPVTFSIDTEECGQPDAKPEISINGPTQEYTPSVEQEEDCKYNVSVTPTEPGPHTIKVSLQGHEVPGSPFEFTVLEDESRLDPDLCSARGPGLAKAIAGRPARFGIITPEEGLLEKDPNALTVEIASEDGKTKVQPTIEDLKNKTYGVTYTVPIDGDYLISIKVYGEPIPGCDYKITALPKPDPAKCRVYGPCLHPNALLLSGRPLELYIDVKNAGTGELQAIVQGPKKTSPKIFTAEEDGVCSLRVDTDRPGWYRINIWWGQVHIPDSPIDLKVHQAPDASKVRVYGPGIAREIQAHRPAEFFIETADAGIGTLTVKLHGVKDAFDVDVKPENPINPRRLKGVYQPREGGDYEVTVSWSDVEIPGSPFKVKVVDWESEMAEKEREREFEREQREKEREKERREKKRRKQKEKLRQERLMYMNAGGYPGIIAPQGGVVSPTYMQPGGVVNPTYMAPNGGLVAANNPTIMGMMMGGAGGGETVTTKRIQQESRQSRQQHKLVRRSTEAGFSEETSSKESKLNSKKGAFSRSRTSPAFSEDTLQRAAIESETSLTRKPRRNAKLTRSQTAPGISEDTLPKATSSMKKSSSYRGPAEEVKKTRPPMIKQRSLTSIQDAMAKNAGKLGDDTPIGGKMTVNWAKLYNVSEEKEDETAQTPSPPRLRKLERRVSFSSDLEVGGAKGRSNFGFKNEEDIPVEEPVKYTPVYVATGEIPLDVYEDEEDEDDKKKKKKKGKKKSK